MSEDLNKKLKQVADMLGQDTIPDNIQNLLGMLLSSAPGGSSHDEEAPSPKAPPLSPAREEKAEKNDMDDSIDMMRKVKRIMDTVNVNNDPRVNLLNAIRPFLGNKRQGRVSTCIKMLQMSKIARLMDDSDKTKF